MFRSKKLQGPVWLTRELHGPAGWVIAICATFFMLRRMSSKKYDIVMAKLLNNQTLVSEDFYNVLKLIRLSQHPKDFDEYQKKVLLDWLDTLPSLNMRIERPEDKIVCHEIREDWIDIYTMYSFLRKDAKVDGFEMYLKLSLKDIVGADVYE